LELRLLPIGSRINAEGHEIISLTLLGTYGLNSADSNEGAPMTAVLSPTQGNEVGQAQNQQNSADASRALPSALQEGQQRQEAPVQLAREQVRLIQLQLQALGLNPGPADGVYGRQTEAALRQYQARHALPITGWPDEATRRSLEKEASEAQQQRLARQTQRPGKPRQPSEPERLLNEVGGFFQKIFERKER
jgi:peptidoglycan hydrolase-like protein with peptidoglycan-binding domain